MAEALTNFIKNAGLITILHLLITAILVLVSLAFFVSARTRTSMLWFLLIGILPALSGILTMYFKNRIVDQGIGMFSRLSAEGIASGHREAFVDFVVGVVATVGILGLRTWRQQLNKRATTK